MGCNETQDVSYLRFAAVLGPSIATGHPQSVLRQQRPVTNPISKLELQL